VGTLYIMVRMPRASMGRTAPDVWCRRLARAWCQGAQMTRPRLLADPYGKHTCKEDLFEAIKAAAVPKGCAAYNVGVRAL
jgi:hypothetical protein